jgi:hypothetical protein
VCEVECDVFMRAVLGQLGLALPPLVFSQALRLSRQGGRVTVAAAVASEPLVCVQAGRVEAGPNQARTKVLGVV